MKRKKLLRNDMYYTNDTAYGLSNLLYNYDSNLDGKATKIGDENTIIMTLITNELRNR